MKKMICVLLFAGLLLGVGCAEKKKAAGVPEDFAFSLTWGVYGGSSYDSKTGRLVKTTDATNPEEYETELALSEEDLQTVYGLVSALPLAEYPDEYDPHPGRSSSPPETVILYVRMNGREKAVACREIAWNEAGGDAKSRAFLSAVREIERLLTASPEWKALPEYERVYS